MQDGENLPIPDIDSKSSDSDNSDDISFIFESAAITSGGRPNQAEPASAVYGEDTPQKFNRANRHSVYEIESLRSRNVELTAKLANKKLKFASSLKSKEDEILALKSRHAGELLSAKYVCMLSLTL